MSKGIIIDDLDKVVERLKDSDFDDDKFAYEQYSEGDSTFDIGGETVHTLQGEVTYPRDEFAVGYDALYESNVELSESPPGIIAYLKGARQLKGTSPAPRDIGFPALTNDTNVGIRWLFSTDNTGGSGPFTGWERLSEDEVDELESIVTPNKSVVRSAREDAGISGGSAYPESERIVSSRVHDHWWEVWCARCQELMNSWRVVLPAGSADPRPVVLSPHNTIVSNNFNFVTFPNGKKAVAAAAVLSSDTIQEQIPQIVPWSKGGGTGRDDTTPRPGVKHFRALLHKHRSKVADVVDDDVGDVSTLAENLEQFHEAAVETLRGFLTTSHSGPTLRNYYSSIPNDDNLEYEIESVKEPSSDEVVFLGTTGGDIKIEFSGEASQAASMAVGSWFAAARGSTIGDVLNLPALDTTPSAVQNVLYDTAFDDLRAKVESEYI